MRLLIDSHYLLWSGKPDAAIPPPIRALLATPERLAVSAASVWELTIKVAGGRLQLDNMPVTFARALINAGALGLPVTFEHAAHVLPDPPATRDPFDRLLLAQCDVEGMRLLTIDRALARHRLAHR